MYMPASPSDKDEAAFIEKCRKLYGGKPVAIVVSPYYQNITDQLKTGALSVLEAAKLDVHQFEVPGALEIPAAIAKLVPFYHGFVALGCVIRGETSHYDIVAGQSARALMDIALAEHAAIGNGILTVDTMQQAEMRASTGHGNKGKSAAIAMLSLMLVGQLVEGNG